MPKDGQCCGECIQKHCVFQNQTYSPGDVWRSDDKCLFYECAEITDGNNIGAKITSYKKACPNLGNCPSDQVYVKDCCAICKSVASTENEEANEFFTNNDEIMSKDTYLNHSCRRECVKDASPQTCSYKFVVSQSKAF